MTPINVVVLHDREEVEVEGVETWWYDELDLVLRFPSGETKTYSGANVIGRF